MNLCDMAEVPKVHLLLQRHTVTAVHQSSLLCTPNRSYWYMQYVCENVRYGRHVGFIEKYHDFLGNDRGTSMCTCCCRVIIKSGFERILKKDPLKTGHNAVQVNLLKDQDMTYGKNPIGICNM